ncbi:sensor histidine kinase [Millisia brevis]|uniref:sensor histidine kinase n=1 Tax=Millisia brevis TaxID=264148 RepID=UPI0012EE2CCF|nr:ATP-binding protein [Millisia brevis]
MTAAVAIASTFISAAIAAESARSSAAAAAAMVAQAIVAPLSVVDIGAADAQARSILLREIRAFMDAGVVQRIKIWQVEGDEAVVLYSDEPRNEGARSPYAPELAARLDAGEVVVLDVPDDYEHEHEYGPEGLLEAFIGFSDAADRAMLLEVYLPSTAPQSLANLLGVVRPIALLGPLVLGAATLPLALRLARRIAEGEIERRELLQTALAASDRERRRLATRLHDGIVQDLASVGLTLDHLGPDAFGDDPDRVALLSRAGDLLDADLAELRGLMTELAPPDFAGSLETALRDLVDDLRGAGTRIELGPIEPVDATPECAALLYRVARELLRNAIAHGGSTIVRVDLRSEGEHLALDVVDDGGGFDPSAPAPEGHLGLSLIRQAVLDSGGDLRISSDAGGTRARVRVCANLHDHGIRPAPESRLTSR